MDMPSITIHKSFTFRTLPHVWSNTYHFDSDAPTTTARWKALADAIIASEKTVYTSDVKVIQATGYAAGNTVAVFSYDYHTGTGDVPGTLAIGTQIRTPGDVAFWVRWSTDQLTSRGKPIFLRSYFHDAVVVGNTTGGKDAVGAAQAAAAAAFGAAWVAGFSDGTITHHRAGPRGAIGQAVSTSVSTTTRTLLRRGKRP